MAIPISTNFKLGAAMPLDARQKVDTIEDRNAIDTGLRYDGLKTYVVEVGRTYVLKGGITNDCWVAEDVITNDMIESLADISSSMGQTWWGGYIPFVKSDGGVELGQYVDFHMESADEIDRTARIRIYDDSGTPRFKFEGSSSGSLAHLTVKNLSAEQYHGTYYGTFGYPAKITLNGEAYTYNGNSASAEEFAAGLTFYAPKSAGTEGYLLLADSTGLPEWTDTLPYTTKFKTSESGTSLSLANFYSAFTTSLTSISSQISNTASAANAYTNTAIEGITVSEDMIEDGAVTAAKLADGAITEIKVIHSMEEFYGAYLSAGAWKKGDLFFTYAALEANSDVTIASGTSVIPECILLRAAANPPDEWTKSLYIYEFFSPFSYLPYSSAGSGGLMSAENYEKLDGISEGATKAEASSENGYINIDGETVKVYAHPTTTGYSHIPPGGAAGQILGYSADGEAQWVSFEKAAGYPIGGTSSYGDNWGYIPVVKSDGGAELGQYIDFHIESADEIDRTARIRIYDDSGTPRFKLEGSSSGSLAHLTVKNLSAEQYHGTYYGTFGYPAEITLNGTTYTYNGNSASAEEFAAGLTFYAPKSAGTEGYVLLADSAGIPEWTDTLPYTTKFKTSESGVSLSLGNFYSAFTTMANAVTTLTNTVASLESRIEALETASE